MVLNSRKFVKLKNKIEKKLIGINSQNGLGCDLTLNKYTFTKDKYGDPTPTLSSTSTIKGIILNSTDYEVQGRFDTNSITGELKIYISIDEVVEDDETYKYEFVLNDKTYVLVKSNPIGQVCNLAGVVKEITIKIKK